MRAQPADAAAVVEFPGQLAVTHHIPTWFGLGFNDESLKAPPAPVVALAAIGAPLPGGDRRARS